MKQSTKVSSLSKELIIKLLYSNNLDDIFLVLEIIVGATKNIKEANYYLKTLNIDRPIFKGDIISNGGSMHAYIGNKLIAIIYYER